MEPERLQEIIEPLEEMLFERDFQMDGEPVVEGVVRRASFVGPDGSRIGYTIKVEEDVDNGDYASRSRVHMGVKLYKGEEVVDLWGPDYYASSNMPAPSLVRDIVKEYIWPNLQPHL